MAIVGGTASKLGGGKFSNGAVSGAFVHMFNAEGGYLSRAWARTIRNYNETMDGLTVSIFGVKDINMGETAVVAGYVANSKHLNKGNWWEINKGLQSTKDYLFNNKSRTIRYAERSLLRVVEPIAVGTAVFSVGVGIGSLGVGLIEEW